MVKQTKVNLQRNQIFHLEDSMVMYGIYNSDTLEKLINTIYKIHNTTTWNENLFAGKLNHCFYWYLSKDGDGHYAINSILYLTTLKENYVKIYEKFISELQMDVKMIRILLKGYLPISRPLKLQKILGEIKKLFRLQTQTMI